MLAHLDRRPDSSHEQRWARDCGWPQPRSPVALVLEYELVEVPLAVRWVVGGGGGACCGGSGSRRGSHSRDLMLLMMWWFNVVALVACVSKPHKCSREVCGGAPILGPSPHHQVSQHCDKGRSGDMDGYENPEMAQLVYMDVAVGSMNLGPPNPFWSFHSDCYPQHKCPQACPGSSIVLAMSGVLDGFLHMQHHVHASRAVAN